MHKLALLATAMTAVSACSQGPSRLVHINVHTRDCPVVYSASLIEVALDPRRYAGYCVGVSGFYQSGRLFLSSEDARHLNGVLTLAVSEEPGISVSPCESSRLFLAGPLKLTHSGSPILIPQHARQPGPEGVVCIPSGE